MAWVWDALVLSSTASAGLWSGLLQWSRYGINALVFVLLTRWLTLAEIGLVAAAQASFVVVQTLQSAVIPDLMVQERDDPDDHRSTLLLASVGVGSLVSVIVIAAVLVMPGIGLDTTVGRYLIAFSPLPVIGGVGNVYEGLLRRRLEMRSLALRTLCATALAGATAIGLAASGFGGWAMVWLSLVSGVSSTVLAIVAARWTPSLCWDRDYLRSIHPQAVALVMGHLLSAAIVPLLSIVVSVRLGATAAGMMQVAFRVLGLIDAVVVGPLRDLTVPLFARAAHPGRDVGQAVLAAASVGALLLFPAYAGVMVTAPTLMPLMFGPTTGPAVVTSVQWLLPFGILSLVTWTVNNALVATGRAMTVARRNYAFYPLVVVPGVVAAFHSLSATLLIHAVWGGVVGAILAAAAAQRHLGLPPGRFVSPLVRPLVCTVVMSVAVWWVGETAPVRGASLAVLQAGVGLAVYGSLVVVVAREQVARLLDLVRRRGPNRISPLPIV